MALLFLILILTGGHLSFKSTDKSKMDLIRMQGYHHYFEVFFLGLVMFSLVFVITAFPAGYFFKCNLLKEFSAALGTKQPALSYPVIFTFAFYLIVARFFGPCVQNNWAFNEFLSTKKVIVPPSDDSAAKQLQQNRSNYKKSIKFKFFQESGNALERLLAWSMEKSKPVFIATTNNKVYVGYITDLYDPSTQVECKDFVIVPVKSGYRAGEDKKYKIFLNKDYIQYAIEKYFDSVLKGIKEQIKQKKVNVEDGKCQFNKAVEDIDVELILKGYKEENILIVLPIAEVCSAGPYDEALYKKIELVGEE